MTAEEKFYLEVLDKYYKTALSVVKDIIGKEEVEYLMEDKEVYLEVCYERTDWFGLCKDYEFFYKIVVNSDLFYMKKKLLIETLIYEIIHTFKNTKAHDGMWLYYADMITVSTPYDIRYYCDLDEEEFRDRYLI